MCYKSRGNRLCCHRKLWTVYGGIVKPPPSAARVMGIIHAASVVSIAGDASRSTLPDAKDSKDVTPSIAAANVGRRRAENAKTRY